eukprot:CAMPEP_0170497594 /NCGR_PEP_ID=MMETSP0208-20121228/25148_1 /TAXON_ID=197538 /ORGANISM="Strombidium inclinatum, Strain S3" /LENGTH=116 /DNA_ID=CAMNT_0010774455 /DNA_START=889 /DNA_END=1236 /DNA_ORIENTATION=+
MSLYEVIIGDRLAMVRALSTVADQLTLEDDLHVHLLWRDQGQGASLLVDVFHLRGGSAVGAEDLSAFLTLGGVIGRHLAEQTITYPVLTLEDSSSHHALTMLSVDVEALYDSVPED